MDSGNENKPEENIDRPTKGMDSLPREVALDILSRLSITSLMRFRFVSQSWQKLSCDPDLINLHHLSHEREKNNPILIFQSKYPVENQLHFVEISDHRKKIVRKIRTPFSMHMPEFNIVGSCKGLLCLSNSDKNNDVLQICNPFTRNYKVLPDSRQFDDQKVLVGFGYHPLTNDYKVVRIVYYQDVYEHPCNRLRRGLPAYAQSQVQVYTVGSNDWRSIGRIPYQLERRSSGPLLVNGRLHWVTRAGIYSEGYARNMISFDLADEQFREVPTPDSCCIRRCPDPLAVLGGCLALVVHRSYRKLEIWVMKEYNVRESWTKDFEIDVYGPSPTDGCRGRTTIQSLVVQVLCLTKNGKILLVHNGTKIALYDPGSRDHKNVIFEGIGNLNQVVVVEGSVAWIENE